MKEKFMKTFAAVLVMATLFCSAAYAAEWKEVGKEWFYELDDGNVARNCWITGEDGSEYYLGADGAMLTNQWIAGDNVWYYVDGDGKMVKGSMIDVNNSYYLMGNDGVMLTNSWYQDPDNGEWYYFGADGAAYKNGWYNIDGDEYYFLKSSKMAHGDANSASPTALVPGGGVVGPDGKRIS